MFPRILLVITVVLFSTIGVLAFMKKGNKTPPTPKPASARIEIPLHQEVKIIPPAPAPLPAKTGMSSPPLPPVAELPLPDANRIQEFFSTKGAKFPIVETITYKSRVPWQKGRPAWLSDYASHYATSRHFIARSLNGKPEYFKQDVSEGDRFNVLNPEKKIEFYLLVDTSRTKLWFYYLDLDAHERVLVKTYQVGLGRVDPSSESGLLTPLGKYSLGDKIAIYKPKSMGLYNGQRTEMVKIFGTRWIPFDQELGNNSAPSKGFGIHGVPWVADSTGKLEEDAASLGRYESDGCIRLATPDIEELFSIIITRPTTIEIVKNFYDAVLPEQDQSAAMQTTNRRR